MMVKHSRGRLIGTAQLIFWGVLIPWIIITMPMHLYYTTHPTPNWLSALYALPWVDWRIGLMICLTLDVLLLGGGLIWTGWQMMHPITAHSIKTTNLDRLKLVKGFSKKQYLTELQENAQKYRQNKEK